MKLSFASGLLIAAVALHFVAVFAGIYSAQKDEGFVWFDNILHIMAGAAFALLWLQFFSRYKILLLFFVLFVAIGWELFEVGLYLFFKSGALGLTFYPPSWNEAFYDSVSTVVGGALILLWGLARQSAVSRNLE